MAVSFTAEYLYQGAKYLTPDPNPAALAAHTPCRERLFIAGRGGYTLGVVVVAPVGVIYHICAAAVNALAARCAENPRGLEEYMWQHLNAALKDLMAFGSTAYTFFMVGVVVAALLLQAPSLLVPPGLLVFMRYVQDVHFEDFSLPYVYAMQPISAFVFFLSDQPSENGGPNQREVYRAYWTINKMIRGGIASDGPISEEEARAWAEGMRVLESPQASPVDKMLVSPTLLLQYNRTTTAQHRSNVENFCAARGHLNTAWENSLREHAQNRLDRDAILQTFRNKCVLLGPGFAELFDTALLARL